MATPTFRLSGRLSSTENDGMHERHPLAASSFWFLVGAVALLLGTAALLYIPGWSAYFFAHPVLLRVGFILLGVLFAMLAACGSVLGFLAETIPGRRDGWVGTFLFFAGIACLAVLWTTRVP
ncbi:MAG: hypothetical protein K2X38_17025 [Gemmataceae bacterium]|nr:hypothetical protein [Gemmataceae bacterium]